MSDVFTQTVLWHLAPVRALLDNDRVSEVLVNGPDAIYVEIDGRVSKVKNAHFPGEDELRAACVNLAQYVGRVLDEEHPRMDGRLPDGSRVHVVIPPVSRMIHLAIRKFGRKAFSPDDLVRSGSLSAAAAKYLNVALQLKKNILVSGGTGSGKTSLLNALSAFIPEADRVVVIEDTGELQLARPHLVQLETRTSITMRDLLHSALRLRPDRIVIGEVRGGEALDLLNALNSGHGGTMATLHANSAEGALTKLETLVLFAGEELPIRAIRAQIASAVDVVVQIGRQRDGSRRIEQIAEVDSGLDTDGNYRTRDLFRLRHRPGPDGKVIAELVPTGNPPRWLEDALDRGYKLDPASFAANAAITPS